MCVGRIGRPHGVRGELAVEVRTDEPERRFLPGVRLVVRGRHPGLPPALTLAAVRRHQDRLLVGFEEVADRTAAEPLRGAMLYAEVGEETPEDPEEFYDHQLVGLDVVGTDGERLGRLDQVLHHGAQDLLVVATDDGEVLVPFVEALVPTVDVAGGRLVVDDRPGLFSA
ncbi:ribosome maturation factor RimM [Nocardioides mangrovicus]|uniref:ribosome maturation factor RimM n=1 Tax=Nocardioides mangrovicus TaxID=2478913 RepID=UPI0018E0C47F